MASENYLLGDGEAMNDEILAQLRDVHWPKTSFWPLAPGFYLIALLIALLILMVVLIYRRSKKSFRKEALKELEHIAVGFNENGDVALLQASLSALIRRMVKTKFHCVGPLEIDSLKPHLLKLFGNQAKTEKIVELLVKDRFSAQPAIDGAMLLNLVREQIKRCGI